MGYNKGSQNFRLTAFILFTLQRLQSILIPLSDHNRPRKIVPRKRKDYIFIHFHEKSIKFVNK